MLKRENIELIHYPTERMITDYYTKPLHGSLFRKMREILMDVTPFPDEDRVGLNENISTEKIRKRVIVLKSSKNCSDDVNRKRDDVRSKKYCTRTK